MAVRALTVNQSPIKARVGPQNATRILTNATSPPTKLINLDDVDSTFQSDGLILVWDLPSRQFLMTSVIDSASTTIEGIAYFTNTENSFDSTSGALIVSGGVGISKNLNVGLGLTVTGVSVFKSSVDIEGAVEILNNLSVLGVTTFTNTVNISGEANISNDTSITGTLSVDGLISTTDGLYYETADVNDPNGIAYFDTTGKLITSPNTSAATNTSNYILTTDPSDLPIWTTTIDGGEF